MLEVPQTMCRVHIRFVLFELQHWIFLYKFLVLP